LRFEDKDPASSRAFRLAVRVKTEPVIASEPSTTAILASTRAAPLPQLPSRSASLNAIFRKPKPSGRHSIASGRASNASVAVRAGGGRTPRRGGGIGLTQRSGRAEEADDLLLEHRQFYRADSLDSEELTNLFN